MLADRYKDSPPPALEWNFADLCPRQEREICHDWETWRELVLNDRAPPGLLNWVSSLRRKYWRRTFPQTAEALRSSDELAQAEWHWLMLVGCHEWPAEPYLSIGPEQRIQRLQLLLCEFFDSSNIYLALAMDMLPYRLAPGWESKLRALQLAGKVPKLWVETLSLFDFDTKLRTGKSDRPRGLKYLLVPVLIDPAWTEKEFISRSKALWHGVIEGPKKRKASEAVESSKLLNQLAAYRLVKDFRMSCQQAIEFTTDNRSPNIRGAVRPLYKNAITFRRAVSECAKYLRARSANSR